MSTRQKETSVAQSLIHLSWQSACRALSAFPGWIKYSIKALTLIVVGGRIIFSKTVLKHHQGRVHSILYNPELILLFRYIPPLLWGKSGHLQTVLYGKMGRVSTPTPCGVRKFLPMQDGATATFDLFEALGDHSTGGQRNTEPLV